ncbi:MAG: chaperone NapD [Rhodocyclaceae bacterium]|jgi:nitrate reductase NapD|nr:chaperone NapD [Rhodocyclaceae bacterium]MBK6907670.1 chaperone NapD [Rhodocyclaceae bacterium]
MNISSAIVIPNPDRIDMVVAALKLMSGIEVAVVSPEGKIIVTIESDDDRGTLQTYEALSLQEGVLSVSMVYHQKETNPDSPIDLQA